MQYRLNYALRLDSISTDDRDGQGLGLEPVCEIG